MHLYSFSHLFTFSSKREDRSKNSTLSYSGACSKTKRIQNTYAILMLQPSWSAAAYPVLAYYPTASLHTKESKNLAIVNEINLEQQQIAQNEQVM